MHEKHTIQKLGVKPAASACNTDTTPTQPGWSFNLQHGYHSNPTRLKLQPATRIPLQPNQAEASTCNTDTTPTQPGWSFNLQPGYHSNPTRLKLQPATRIPLQPNQAEASACNTDTTPTKPHRNSNTHRTKNNTTNVVIQQNSRKLLMMDILMSETCWAHKKWNKIAGGIKSVFYSSNTLMFDILIVRCSRHNETRHTIRHTLRLGTHRPNKTTAPAYRLYIQHQHTDCIYSHLTDELHYNNKWS